MPRVGFAALASAFLVAAACATRPAAEPRPRSAAPPAPAVHAAPAAEAPPRPLARSAEGPAAAPRLPAAPPIAKPDRAAAAAPAPRAPATRRVGLLFPSQGRYRGFGAEARRGAELCLEDGAERGLRLETVFQEETDAADAAELLAGFGGERGTEVVAIIGPLLSGNAERLLPLAARQAVPVISPTAASVRLGEQSPVFFRTCLTMPEFADALAGFVAGRLGRPAVAILSPAQQYGRSFAAAFGGALEARGGSVLLVREYDPGLRDLAAWAAALRKDLRPAGWPDASAGTSTRSFSAGRRRRRA